MLVMVLLGLLIPLGVGVLALMELKAPPRPAVAVVQPLAETTVGISNSHDVLAKTDRLEVTIASSELSALASSETPALAGSETPAQVSSETPPQPALADEHISPSESITVAPASAPPRVIKRHRLDPKPRKVVTVALPKPKPKAADTRRTTLSARSTLSERSKGAGDSESCRLSAFGGLRKALNSTDCEI